MIGLALGAFVLSFSVLDKFIRKIVLFEWCIVWAWVYMLGAWLYFGASVIFGMYILYGAFKFYRDIYFKYDEFDKLEKAEMIAEYKEKGISNKQTESPAKVQEKDSGDILFEEMVVAMELMWSLKRGASVEFDYIKAQMLSFGIGFFFLLLIGLTYLLR